MHNKTINLWDLIQKAAIAQGVPDFRKDDIRVVQARRAIAVALSEYLQLSPLQKDPDGFLPYDTWSRTD